ncbi:YraN family protein [Agaribacter flavus]|uniref:UPF0102 protein ACFOHL_05610 n=1 Tax=Agaribacter flavus TaxID=1902781 RepID=A0ABV7FQF4_9ALTE
MAIKQWEAPNIGALAETKAKQYLLDQGLRFVEANYKSKSGEIDLIFKQAQLWLFVEVKYRSDNSHGSAAEFFTPNKRRKVVNAIMCYFMEKQRNIHHEHIRVDLIAIDNNTLQWIKNV